MFNPEKDLAEIIIECLGPDGLSISSLDKKLQERGITDHRLVLTGYLRAMTDFGYLRMKDVPPAKIYIPAKKLPENIYQAVWRLSKEFSGKDSEEITVYTLYRFFKRPIFESELKAIGIFRPIGTVADKESTDESRKLLRKAGNVVPSGNAYIPVNEYPAEFDEIASKITMEYLDAQHLVQQYKQTTFF